VVLKEAVDEMKAGSVIVDLAASTGGNCELTKHNEIITTDNGVIIVGKLSQLPSQASQPYWYHLLIYEAHEEDYLYLLVGQMSV